MLKFSLLASSAALALSFLPTSVSFGPAPAHALARADANDCVILDDDNHLFNSCPFTVWVTWCVENVDCRDSQFTNSEDLGPGGRYPVYGAKTGNPIHWGVCRAPAMPINRANFSFVCK